MSQFRLDKRRYLCYTGSITNNTTLRIKNMRNLTFTAQLIDTNNMTRQRNLTNLSLSQVGRIDSMLPGGWICIRIIETTK